MSRVLYFPTTCTCLFLFISLLSTLSFSQTQQIKYVGSSTIGNYIRNADDAYTSAYFSIDVESESAGGEKAILEGKADLAGVANVPAANTLNRGVISTLIGYDAIAVVVHESNPIRNLTLEQLKEVFNGQIKNWNQIGGPDMPVRPFIVGIESATHKVFRSAVLGPDKYAGCETVSPDISIIEKIKNTPGGIGHISYSFLKNAEGIRIPNIDGQALSLTNKAYPITRPLFLLWWSGRRDVEKFVQWSLSPEGQRLVMEQFVGLWEGLTNFENKPGKLIVYTETFPVEDGGTFYYPHTGYNILDSEHKLIKHVNNHLSNNDESPTPVQLEPGNYIIEVNNDKNKKEFYIKISAGQITKLNTSTYSINNNENVDKKLIKTDAGKSSRFSAFGDFRLRAAKDYRYSDERFRGRFRLRLGFNANISRDLKLGVRVTSTANPDNPNTPYADFAEGFDNVQLVIDRAFIHYQPSVFKNFNLWLGKFANPLRNNGIFTELIWDADVQPDGAAFSMAFNQSGIFNKIELINGSYLLSDFRTNRNKYWMQSNQLNLYFKTPVSFSLQLSSGFNLYPDMKDQEFSPYPFDEDRGNSFYNKININANDTLLTTHYNTGFFIHHNFLLLQLNQFKEPLIFRGDYFNNYQAEYNNNVWSLGFSYGDLKNVRQWKVYYQYQKVEQDALFTIHAQDDFQVTSAFTGHVFGLAYNFHEKISLHGWALLDKLIEEPKYSQSRWRIDLNVKL